MNERSGLTALADLAYPWAQDGAGGCSHTGKPRAGLTPARRQFGAEPSNDTRVSQPDPSAGGAVLIRGRGRNFMGAPLTRGNGTRCGPLAPGLTGDKGEFMDKQDANRTADYGSFTTLNFVKCARGFVLVSGQDYGRSGQPHATFAFDRIEDVAQWLVEEYGHDSARGARLTAATEPA